MDLLDPLPDYMSSPQALQDYILTACMGDIAECEQYQDTVVRSVVRERYEYYMADQALYQAKFPKLSKASNIVSTDVADTIEWALPSLMKIFFGSEDVITVNGVHDEDEAGAEVMQDLIKYQIQRKNNSFVTFYNWFKDSMITGMGVIKCSWEREEGQKQQTQVMAYANIQQLAQDPNVTIIEPPTPADNFGNYNVNYSTTYYAKNNPKIENILISELLYPPRLQCLDDAQFVAHRKRVNVSYLRQKEKDGVYANIEECIDHLGAPKEDLLELEIVDDYYPYRMGSNNPDIARRETTLYECYTKLDINGDGILEDMIVTICNKIIIRMEENVFGRHPFFVISPIKDPHRLFPRRSFAELLGQLQDLKTALIRQIMLNIALTNDPKLIMAEEAINLDDYIQGRAVIRKKPGYAMNDVVQPMPITPLHPWTFQLLEYAESQKENRTGITRYNQGLDANTLNKTATGISAIMGASNQRLELIARMFAETGIQELFRFLITLNQKFIDQATVIRVTDKQMAVRPDDIGGEFDLVVNAGIGISSRESNMMNLQTLLTAMLQLNQSGVPVATPTNFYNLVRRWMNEAGIKDSSQYTTDPAMVQQRAMIDIQMKQQIVASLPPQLQQEYAQTGTLPPQVMLSLPENIQMILGGNAYGGQGTQPQTGASTTDGFGGGNGASPGVFGQLLGSVPRMDNRQPQNVRPHPGSQVSQSPGGFGGS